jgi:hypothetical protein
VTVAGSLPAFPLAMKATFYNLRYENGTYVADAEIDDLPPLIRAEWFGNPFGIDLYGPCGWRLADGRVIDCWRYRAGATKV